MLQFARDWIGWLAPAVLGFVLCLTFGTASAQVSLDRLAFVVGNSSYEWRSDDQPLPGSKLNLVTPRADALAFADTLEGLGWQLINDALFDRSARALRDDLAAAAKQITSGSEVVFVFNGHGFSDNDTNYLVGVPETGERYHTPGDMQTGSVSLDEVITVLSEGEPKRIILIINACGDEPLVSTASRESVRPDYDELKPEILVLYSSSPRGIAYDVIGNGERLEAEMEGAGPVHSLFSRHFLAQMIEKRPLLSIFPEVRIAVERQSEFAADDRNLSTKLARQIPHVLFDNIDGRFQLARGDSSEMPAVRADWRMDPRFCRVDEDARQQAIKLRAEGQMGLGPGGDAVRSCLVEGALGDLGIAKIGYDAEARSVIVNQTNTASTFRAGDRISLVNVALPGQARQRFTPTSLDAFNDMLARTYFSPGSKFAFGWRRSDGTLPASGFEPRSF